MKLTGLKTKFYIENYEIDLYIKHIVCVIL